MMGHLIALLGLALDAASNSQSTRRFPSGELTSSPTISVHANTPVAASPNSVRQQFPDVPLPSPQQSGVTSSKQETNDTEHAEKEATEEGEGDNEDEDEDDEEVLEQLRYYASSIQSHNDYECGDGSRNIPSKHRAYLTSRPPPFKFELHAPRPPRILDPALDSYDDKSKSPKSMGVLQYSLPPAEQSFKDRNQSRMLAPNGAEFTESVPENKRRTFMADMKLAVEMVRSRKRVRRNRFAAGVDIYKEWQSREENRRGGNGGGAYCVPSL